MLFSTTPSNYRMTVVQSLHSLSPAQVTPIQRFKVVVGTNVIKFVLLHDTGTLHNDFFLQKHVLFVIL